MEPSYLLENALKNHIEKTNEIVSSAYKTLNLSDNDELNEIENVVKNYFFNVNEQKKYKTVAYAAVFYVQRKSNPKLSINHFHETLLINSKSLKDCVKQIENLESKFSD
jgi:hypothetical protein